MEILQNSARIIMFKIMQITTHTDRLAFQANLAFLVMSVCEHRHSVFVWFLSLFISFYLSISLSLYLSIYLSAKFVRAVSEKPHQLQSSNLVGLCIWQCRGKPQFA